MAVDQTPARHDPADRRPDDGRTACGYIGSAPGRRYTRGPSTAEIDTIPSEPPDPSSTDAEVIDLASVDRVLSTARSVRRNLDFDRDIDPRIIHQCIDIATQAPTGIGGENWRFVVVTDNETKAQLAELYSGILLGLFEQRGEPVKPTHRALIDRLHEIPAMIFVCSIGTPADTVGAQVGFYGSILPAAWSLMLALRARGLGTTWTTLMSARQDAVAEILGIPDGVTQTVMLPVAWAKGARLRPAERQPAAQVTYWNRWGQPPDHTS